MLQALPCMPAPSTSSSAWQHGASVRVVGCGNGDPTNHDPNHAPWKPAYHGLVRAIIKATVRATCSAASRKLEALVNPDAGRGAFFSAIEVSGKAGIDLPASSTVVAESLGLPRATLVVPLSVNPADDPLNVAPVSVGLAEIGE